MLHSLNYHILFETHNIEVQFIDASHQNYKSRYFLWNEQNVFVGGFITCWPTSRVCLVTCRWIIQHTQIRKRKSCVPYHLDLAKACFFIHYSINVQQISCLAAHNLNLSFIWGVNQLSNKVKTSSHISILKYQFKLCLAGNAHFTKWRSMVTSSEIFFLFWEITKKQNDIM